jgi:hypothetical protein
MRELLHVNACKHHCGTQQLECYDIVMPHTLCAMHLHCLQVAVEKNDQLDAGDLVVFIDASQVCTDPRCSCKHQPL